jgi:hypothetical protein
MPNPFFVSGPVSPQQFVGRTPDVLDAFDHILNCGHVAIWGGPGMGKSSFLEYLSSPQAWQSHGYNPTSIIFVSLNCAVTINPFMPTQFWREILSRLQEKLDSSTTIHAKIGDLLQKAY